MSASRTLQRKKEREQKQRAKDKLATITKILNVTPEKCDECAAPFDKKDIHTHAKWRVAVYDTGEVNLVCPDCGWKDEHDDEACGSFKANDHR